MAKLFNFLKRLFKRKKNKERRRRGGGGGGCEKGDDKQDGNRCITPVNKKTIITPTDLVTANPPDNEKLRHNRYVLDKLAGDCEGGCSHNIIDDSGSPQHDRYYVNCDRMPHHDHDGDHDDDSLLGSILTTSPSNEAREVTGSLEGPSVRSSENNTNEQDLFTPLSPRYTTSGDKINCRIQDAKTTIVRASTPEKADLLPTLRDECKYSPTSVIMLDSEQVSDSDLTKGSTAHDGISRVSAFQVQIDTPTTSQTDNITSLLLPAGIMRNIPGSIFGDDTEHRGHTEGIPSSNEFLSLKKDTEKDEFKKVALLNKKSTGVSSLKESQDGNKKLAKRSEMSEPHEMIEVHQVDVGGVQVSPSSPTTEEQQKNPSDTPSHLNTKKLIDSSPSSSSSSSPPPPSLSSNIVVDVIPPVDYQQFLDDMRPDDEDTFSYDSCSYDSAFETIGDITICSETKRLMEARQKYENDSKINHPPWNKKGILKVKTMPIEEILVQRNDMVRPVSVASTRIQSIRTELARPNSIASSRFPSIRTEMDVPMDDCVSLPSVQPIKQRKITWYDDEVHWNKPFTLRTDESFDMSTVTNSRMSSPSGYSRSVKPYNVVDNLLGDFIKGIGKYTCFDEKIATSFDYTDHQEI